MPFGKKDFGDDEPGHTFGLHEIKLLEHEQPQEKVEKEPGSYEPIGYKQAIELSGGCVMWSNNRKDYRFQKERPVGQFYFLQVQDAPANWRFEYNIMSKKMRVMNGGQLVGVFRKSG